MYRFLSKIAVFYAFFTLFCGFLVKNVQSEEIYNISEVFVNVEGESPADARTLGFQRARKEAFATLLVRLGVDINFIDEVKNEEITSLVRSERVFDEKYFGNNYSANFTVYFAKDFVDDLFLRKKMVNIKKKSAKDVKFLMIPVKRLLNRNLLWESGNDFRNYVKESVASKEIRNFIIPEADIDNLAVVSAQNVAKVGAKDVDYLLDKYGADIAYIAFYSYDAPIRKASVLVRGFEGSRRFQYRLSFINSNGLDEDRLVKKVSSKVVEYLSELKLEEIKTQGVDKDMVAIEIPVRNLGQWMMVKKRIERSSFVHKMEIKSVSRDFVKITVLCEDSLNIQAGFAQMGFNLTPRSQNLYLLTF